MSKRPLSKLLEACWSMGLSVLKVVAMTSWNQNKVEMCWSVVVGRSSIKTANTHVLGATKSVVVITYSITTTNMSTIDYRWPLKKMSNNTQVSVVTKSVAIITYPIAATNVVVVDYQRPLEKVAANTQVLAATKSVVIIAYSIADTNVAAVDYWRSLDISYLKCGHYCLPNISH